VTDRASPCHDCLLPLWRCGEISRVDRCRLEPRRLREPSDWPVSGSASRPVRSSAGLPS